MGMCLSFKDIDIYLLFFWFVFIFYLIIYFSLKLNFVCLPDIIH